MGENIVEEELANLLESQETEYMILQILIVNGFFKL